MAMKTCSKQWYGLALGFVAISTVMVSASDATTKGADTRLAALKAEFASLMDKRAALNRRFEESMSRLSEMRDTTGTGSGANSDTAKAYRAAAMAVERALDEHPQVKALQDEMTSLRNERFELSKAQGTEIEAWRKAREDRYAGVWTLVEKAKADAEAAKMQVYKRAGLSLASDRIKEDAEKLTSSDQKEIEEIGRNLLRQLAAIRQVHSSDKIEEELENARKEDGSQERFAALSSQSKALDAREADIRRRMGALRDSLRESDPTMATLQSAAFRASQKHVIAADAAPAAADARKFISEAARLKEDIDRQARLLRKAIIEKDPGYRRELERQASSAGLAADEAFWTIEG
jgi:chromosome segregation ATPase